MAQVTNLLNQPLQLDFGTEAIRLLAVETRPLDNKYMGHDALKRNASCIVVTPDPVVEQPVADSQPTVVESADTSTKVSTKTTKN